MSESGSYVIPPQSKTIFEISCVVIGQNFFNVTIKKSSRNLIVYGDSILQVFLRIFTYLNVTTYVFNEVKFERAEQLWNLPSLSKHSVLALSRLMYLFVPELNKVPKFCPLCSHHVVLEKVFDFTSAEF